MWLINTTSNSLELHEFIGEKKPTYAILSHRWEEEEISFKEMKKKRILNSDGKPKKGWLKIAAFCALAASRDYHWAWVDTCCIDKSSSAELQESINSMFKWYYDSGLCMVYMSDAEQKSEQSFMESEWFRRGWTLQELLAPPNIEFFDEQWVSLGSRQQLCRVIASVTNVPIALLYGGHEIYLNNCSVAQRLSWASKRKTTRAEDQAYCLLGLFGVHMPLLYGEGLHNAFGRLQLQVLDKYAEDESILAWTGENYLESHLRFENRHGEGVNLSSLKVQLLADLADFKYCNSIRLTNNLKRRKPFSMTSIGLQAELLLYPRSSFPNDIRQCLYACFEFKDVVIAPLNCSFKYSSIYLVLLPDRTDKTYLRIGWFTTRVRPIGNGQTKDILIRKDPSTENPHGSEYWDPGLYGRIAKTLLVSNLYREKDLSFLTSLMSADYITGEQMSILKRFLEIEDLDKLKHQQGNFGSIPTTMEQDDENATVMKQDDENDSMLTKMILDEFEESEEQQEILKELKESEEKQRLPDELELDEQQRIMDEFAGFKKRIIQTASG